MSSSLLSLALAIIISSSLSLAQQEDAQYSPAQYNPYQYPEARQQAPAQQTPQTLATGEWFTVDSDYQPSRQADSQSNQGPFDLNVTNGFNLASIVRVAVGATIVIIIAVFVMKQLGVLDAISGSPAVKEAMAVLEETIPREARTVEALVPLAQMVFEAIDKYAELDSN